MKIRLGMIAEDNSDIEVITELVCRLRSEDEIIVRKFIGHGCGRIIGKCNQWSEILFIQGCKYLILVQDLDERKLEDLFTTLCNAINGCSIRRRVVVIPIREIEAWLLSDCKAIKNSLGLKQNFSEIPNPQLLHDPKKRLSELIYLRSGKQKRHIISDNRKIASRTNINKLLRLSSFVPLYNFIKEI
jgi:hypothetical protein